MDRIFAGIMLGAGYIVQYWKIALAVVAAVSLSFTLGQCSGKKAGRQEMRTAVAEANTKALEQARRADTLAATQRITDTVAVSTREKELRDAIASTPDSQPDAARIALGCARLRGANGGSSANLPAVCRSGSGTQAGPAR
jgi:hypothetical protein